MAKFQKYILIEDEQEKRFDKAAEAVRRKFDKTAVPILEELAKYYDMYVIIEMVKNKIEDIESLSPDDF